MSNASSRSTGCVRIGSLLVITTAACAPATLQAAGFSLLEQTASGTGVAYAGSGASADDASALYWNPANLSLMKASQIAVVGHGINLQTEFQDRGSTLPLAGLGLLPRGVTQDDAGDFVGVPNAYFSLPVNNRLAFGLGVNAPFGLITEYEDNWVGRFQGIRSELETVNVNPALSIRFTDNIAFGAGFNYQYATVELTNAVLLAPGVEGRALLDVDDDAYGWNAGFLFTLPSQTRIGMSYRSRLDYTLSGDTTVTSLAGTTIAAASGPTEAEITFPGSALISVAQPLGDRAELRADVSWMRWSEVDTIFAVNPNTGVPRDVLNFAFEDSWRVALGTSAKTSDRWTLRGGVAWDQSPVKTDTRTVRLPDSDRFWLSLGARWQPTSSLGLDFGYAHLFVKDGDVNISRGQLGAPASFSSTVLGEYDSSVDLVSLQLTWTFGG